MRFTTLIQSTFLKNREYNDMCLLANNFFYTSSFHRIGFYTAIISFRLAYEGELRASSAVIRQETGRGGGRSCRTESTLNPLKPLERVLKLSQARCVHRPCHHYCYVYSINLSHITLHKYRRHLGQNSSLKLFPANL